MSLNNSPSGTPPLQRHQLSSPTSMSSLSTPTSTHQTPTHQTPTHQTPPTIAINPPSVSSSSSFQPTIAKNTNGERNGNSRTSSSNLLPSTPPRVAHGYNPPVPSRMSGTYSSNNSIYHGSIGAHNSRRLGTSSASSSPPGTPPNGLRDYYLNIAFQRSQNRLYPPGSTPASTANPQRPSISVLVPSHDGGDVDHSQHSGTVRRSYSAGHLAVEEPAIMVTSPGGSNSTQEHVMTLDRALSNLIEREGRSSSQDDHSEVDDLETEGSITKESNKATSALGAVSAGNQEGFLLTPKVLANRQDPEKGPADWDHAVIPIDVTLSEPEASEKEAKEAKRRSHGRFSKFFGRDATTTPPVPAPTSQHHSSGRPPRSSIQPSKAGVLSNLLKLQNGTRPPKTPPAAPKHHKEKKKRSVFYSLSANNSATSVATRSVFGTYPPMPTTATQGTATALGNLGTATQRNGNGNGGGNHQHMYTFDGGFPGAFSAGHSPLQSPIGSRRNSLTYDDMISGASTLHSLSAEEKMRITFAVADILQRQDYVLRLARSMIKFGAPSHRIEDAIDHTARTLELNLQCVYLPNVMIVAFTDYETHTSETHLLRVSAGLNMHKFAQVHQILKLVTHSSMPVEEAIMKLDIINTEQDVWPQWANVVAYGLASFCAAPMFYKGNWVDAGVSLLMGVCVGLMSWLGKKVPSYAHICEITMSVLVAFVAEALHDHVCRSAVKIAGIVMLLPGYTITCSIMELTSRHMISGSVRLFYAIIFSLLLGYGLTIGASIWNLIDPSNTPAAVTAACPQSLDPKWNILFVPLFAFSLLIWLKAHPRQWGMAMFLSIVGYMVSYSLSTWTSAKTEVSSALASFAIGFIGNLYQRVTHQLMFQAVICAVFFLVPGSIGLKGAVAWFTDDAAGGVNFALQMVISAIAISVGLFGSALVVYPMGKARSAQMTF
ncbi:hypothetical protein BGZ99_005791 [Dissophora globulifera]|uniref:DUF1212-domain-containing protein n=1 Tax=Dissophora globulifera TaxID=979702 RepID=A0A9P6UT92_9FUNG|nr:hypothetical protein BGZ99_005791 [Dissophora globulifera]